MTTFTEAKATLDEISDVIANARNRINNARIGYGQAQSTLAGLPAQYSAFLADLDAAAAADTWPLADSQKAEKDQMVADFQDLKDHVEALIAAVDAV